MIRQLSERKNKRRPREKQGAISYRAKPRMMWPIGHIYFPVTLGGHPMTVIQDLNLKQPDDAAILASGVRVMRTEAQAVMDFAAALDENFTMAVNLMYGATGRVIISGMGKSGHIGNKIVATLASTGTPAQFVHPAEAIHGDLGMITANDVIVMLSNSGETAELAGIITYSRRFQIPLIGVASNPDSTLMRASDVRLVLPKAQEACSLGMAPTTSTTLTLALGDALAVALMERRGFEKHNFHDFHPGGKLGAQLALVSKLMHSGDAVPLVGEATPMQEVLLTMTAKSFGVVGVVDARGMLLGIITDGDLRRNMADLMRKTAGEVMSGKPQTVAVDDLAAEALAIMNGMKITCLFVVDEDRLPVGILHIHDCLRAGVA